MLLKTIYANSKAKYAAVVNFLSHMGTLPLRIYLFVEFFAAGMTKWQAGWQAPEWFGQLSFPWPQNILPVDFNWAMAIIGELVLPMMLLLGIGTRFASLGLMYIIFVAVYSVHFDLGWAGWNQIDGDEGQGFKVPLMLAVMALTVFFKGGGCYSVDTLYRRYTRHEKK